MSLVGDSYEYFDRRFRSLTVPTVNVKKLFEDCLWAEGPVWFADGNCLVWSDVPNNRLLRWTEEHGVGTFRADSGFTNGNTRDRLGRLVSCEHGGRRVSRTEPDGRIIVVADKHKGKKLNSPNDVVVKSDGTIWFTDPPYGIKPEEQEQPACHVFRLDPGAKEPTPVAEDFRPNGLAFSPDERFLYVANSDRAAPVVRRYRVTKGNTLEGGELLLRIDPGVPDGFRCDAAGRIFCTAGDGVHVFTSEGRLLGKIKTPQAAANCVFGGPDRKTLFITAVSSVWAVRLKTRGAR